jgi:hypothetical protein
MDNGDEIQGLDQGWTFFGAKASEWIAGFSMCFILADLFFMNSIWSGMPFMLLATFGTAIGLSKVRVMFPDEERGIINTVFVFFGFPPPKIPTPAQFQDFWSGTPIYKLPKDSAFRSIGLYDIYFSDNTEYEEATIPSYIKNYLDQKENTNGKLAPIKTNKDVRKNGK